MKEIEDVEKSNEEYIGRETNMSFHIVDSNPVREIKNAKKSDVEYTGNKMNMSFHTADCKWAPRSAEKKVVFKSKEEALYWYRYVLQQ